MKKILLTALTVIFCLSNVTYAIKHVEKRDPWLHSQPNEGTPITFLATKWGPPGFMEYETSDGYTIIKSEIDDFWYYAILDSTGEYKASEYKVAIDNPPVAQHLRRSANRYQEYLAFVAGHNLRRMSIAERWRYMWKHGYNETINVAVLLLNFDDREVEHRGHHASRVLTYWIC